MSDDLELCGRCMGSGYGGHPDSGVLCADCNGSGGVRADLCADPALLAEAVEVIRRVSNCLNHAFAAGTEERENGSTRRQAKAMEHVEALRADARAFIAKLENRK